jgi:chromosome segregation ATPase
MSECHAQSDVGLGCGTWIILAIMIYFSSGADSQERHLKELKKDVHTLTQEVKKANAEADTHNLHLRQLKDEIRQLKQSIDDQN